MYFVTATATTVGYGDYYANNEREKTYLIFLEFTAICIFSIITGNITSLHSKAKLSDVIKQKQEEIKLYLYGIDKVEVKQELNAAIYDQSIEYMKVSYLHGVDQSIREGGYYKLMPSRMKTKVAFELFDKYYHKFYYFFNDLQGKNYADKVFVRKMLTNLDCQM